MFEIRYAMYLSNIDVKTHHLIIITKQDILYETLFIVVFRFLTRLQKNPHKTHRITTIQKNSI